MTAENVRPWGRYDILYDGDDCKVKRIIVKPGKKLSLQYHYKRNEFWRFISGVGVVTLSHKFTSTEDVITFSDFTLDVSKDAYVTILKEDRHRVENTGDVDLVFIEIQTGTYFGEDDIVRLEDDYGRT